MSQFIESIKVENGKPQLLSLHQKRLEATFSHFRKPCGLSLENIFEEEDFSEKGVFKFRFLYDLGNEYTTEFQPYIFREIKSFQLMENNDICYEFKFAGRSELNKMKQNSAADEIIIVKNGCITDTSFSNLVFLKNGISYTPKTYFLNGVQRQFLLKTKQIQEMEITTDNLSDFSHFRLINAMNDLNSPSIFSISYLV